MINPVADDGLTESNSVGFDDEKKIGGVDLCCYVNSGLLVLMAIYFFLIPFLLMIYYLADPGIKDGEIPRFAVSVHRSISLKYERWAAERIKSGRAAELALHDIAGTEWPVFGSFFYLLATEELQEAWESDNNISASPPKEYAAGAIEAAAALIADPGHAAWVKTHWGVDYLHRENVFYRMLLIGGLTSYERLCGGGKYLDLIADQVESLSHALDESPHGLLDDYPGQCYPTDVLAAIAAIRRADAVLQTDHSDFINRSIRGFSGTLLDVTGLPPYSADSRTGAIGISRGCSSQWMTVWVPELWPEQAKAWYDHFKEHFWQQKYGAVGFREFQRDMPKYDWSFDIDAGPILAGFGASASAFGAGAARANGRFDHAYPLTAEAIVMSWPLPDGTLVIPRCLSSATDAPYVGEAGLLFALTRRPVEGIEIVKGGMLPGIVYCIPAGFFTFGFLLCSLALLRLKRHRKCARNRPVRGQSVQVILWAILVVTGFVGCITGHLAIGILFILFAQLLPMRLSLLRKRVPDQD